MWQRRRWTIVGVLVVASLLEALHHVNSFSVESPERDLDEPFAKGCNVNLYVDNPRENATLFMLARNSELEGAVSSIRSLEESFNQFYHYPVVFLNNEPWSAEFINALKGVVSGEARFEVVNGSYWGYPNFIDQTYARSQMLKQEKAGIKYSGQESYHHMCRFNSGSFYDVPALQAFRYYWRIEPDVDFSCVITYDPFKKMRDSHKVYGYTIALWELETTVKSLFRRVSEYKQVAKIPTTGLWRAAVTPSWLPLPLRRLMGHVNVGRSPDGDSWNLCHYWSNFEIGDMDFFRSDEYRNFFNALDRAGGFYYERWGDAAVHSLAAALFLEPEQLHYFEDIGYQHAAFQNCPDNAAGHQMPDAPHLKGRDWFEESESANGPGCRCRCDPRAVQNRPVCLNKLRRGVEAAGHGLSSWRSSLR